MQYKDYYQIMGVQRDASQDEIKRAYRKLAHKYHPDVSKQADAEARFKEVGEAYEVLKDPEKRAAYDQLGNNWKAGQEFTSPPNWGSGFEFSRNGFGTAGMGGFSDFFEELFGSQTRRGFTGSGFTARGEDKYSKVIIDLEDSFYGATRNISLQVPTLDAQGHLQVDKRTLKVKIPKGIIEGQQIRLAGQGSPGMGRGNAGDLLLQIQFKPHSVYKVERRDLHMQLPVAPWEAALGAKVKLNTPAGQVDLTIPAGSNSGKKLRLRERGIPGSPAGDIYVTLSVVLPPADSDTARALYIEMRDKLAFNPRASMGG